MDLKKVAGTEYLEKPNFDGFILIGAGLPRTGTFSLQVALSHLLKGKVYHMHTVGKGSSIEYKFWNKAIDKNVTIQEWKDFLEGRGFRAGVDYPISAFYRELMEAYPNAKVLLSVRDPQKWYTSVKSTIYQIYQMTKVFPTNILFGLFNRNVMKMVTNLCFLPTNGLPSGMYKSISDGEEASIKHFNQWVDEVKNTVPSEKLLVFEVKEGWGPLCDFLDVPVPSIPFPNTNDTAQMKKRIRGAKIAAYTLVFGVPAIIAAFLYFTKSYWSQYVPFL